MKKLKICRNYKAHIFLHFPSPLPHFTLQGFPPKKCWSYSHQFSILVMGLPPRYIWYIKKFFFYRNQLPINLVNEEWRKSLIYNA